jgi:hypothetical protein|tara:strand:- start:326 stop:532 length:207 start_codon:yes stop_codon:yes gene_type:complete
MVTEATALFETGSGSAGRTIGAAVAETVAADAMIKAATTRESRGTALWNIRRARGLGFFNITAIFSFI